MGKLGSKRDSSRVFCRQGESSRTHFTNKTAARLALSFFIYTYIYNQLQPLLPYPLQTSEHLNHASCRLRLSSVSKCSLVNIVIQAYHSLQSRLKSASSYPSSSTLFTATRRSSCESSSLTLPMPSTRFDMRHSQIPASLTLVKTFASISSLTKPTRLSPSATPVLV